MVFRPTCLRTISFLVVRELSILPPKFVCVIIYLPVIAVGEAGVVEWSHV